MNISVPFIIPQNPPSKGDSMALSEKEARYQPRPLWYAWMLLLILLPGLSMAQVADTTGTRINAYMQEAAQNNPALKAEYINYLSALEQVPQARALPDPELSFGYFIQPIETRVGPQQGRIGVTQMFPWLGLLDDRGDAATNRAKAAFEAFRNQRNRLFMNVEQAWYQLYELQQAVDIMGEHISILETFESLALRRYETDLASQVDVLRVQIEKEDARIRLENLKDDLRVKRHEFNELLNRPAGEEVAVPDSLSPYPVSSFTLPQLENELATQNPQLAEWEQRIASGRHALAAARKEGYPRFGIGFDYLFTGRRDMVLADNGKDALLARGAVTIPLFRGKYRAKEQQATLQLRSARENKAAALNRLELNLQQAIRDYAEAQRRLSLYEDIQIQRTRQAIDILTEQYAGSTTEFEELLRLQRRLLDYELARERALSDQYQSVARIHYLIGKYNINREEIRTR